MGSVMKRCLSYLIDARDCCLYWEMCFLTLPMPIVSTIWRQMLRTLEKQLLSFSLVPPTPTTTWSKFFLNCRNLSFVVHGMWLNSCTGMYSNAWFLLTGSTRFWTICEALLVGEGMLSTTFVELMRIYMQGMHSLFLIAGRCAITLQSKPTLACFPYENLHHSS